MGKLALFVVLVGSSSCAMDSLDGSEVVATTEEIQASNGVSLNGVSLNGVSLNGVSLNGVSLNGVSLNGTTLSGTKLTGGTVSGTGLIGATFVGTATNGTSVNLKINNVYPLAAPNADVLAYVVTYQTSSGWLPLCNNTGNEAIPLSGTWDLTTVKHASDSKKLTWACRAATFAKCVELGYKPWASVAGTSLADYHQTCIRALRADYCGDGKTYTVDGTQINIFDKLGVQADTMAWTLEANWTPDGATCINEARYLTLLSHGAVPSCVSNRASKTCSTTWGGTFIRTEVSR
jgi:hypothetical protein